MDGRVGYAKNTISDSFHGSRARRRYGTRNDILLRRDFDPTADLVAPGDGCLEWTDGKPQLRDDVRRYLGRREGL